MRLVSALALAMLLFAVSAHAQDICQQRDENGNCLPVSQVEGTGDQLPFSATIGPLDTPLTGTQILNVMEVPFGMVLEDINGAGSAENGLGSGICPQGAAVNLVACADRKCAAPVTVATITVPADGSIAEGKILQTNINSGTFLEWQLPAGLCAQFGMGVTMTMGFTS